MRTHVHEQFVVDARGQPQAVMLSWMDYRRLMATLEDLEDALDLKRAIRSAKQFLSHESLLTLLKRPGRR